MAHKNDGGRGRGRGAGGRDQPGSQGSNDEGTGGRVQPTWTPFLPAATGGDFTFADLIDVAGHGLGQT